MSGSEETSALTASTNARKTARRGAARGNMFVALEARGGMAKFKTWPDQLINSPPWMIIGKRTDGGH